jgi:hypothetical protein
MRALKAELDKEAQGAKAQVKKSSEDVKEGRLEGFGFDYTSPPGLRGQVKATAEADGQKARYKLNVSVDEKYP